MALQSIHHKGRWYGHTYCVVTETAILHPHPVNSYLVQDVLENVVLLFLVSIVSALGEVCSMQFCCFLVLFSLFLFVWDLIILFVFFYIFNC